MNLQESIEKALTGNCLLFTGSGFSYKATNILDKDFLLGNGLTELLYERCGIKESDNDLRNASELFLDDFSEHELIELLKNEFTVKNITADQKVVGTIPWKRIYTTNYDNIIETSYAQANRLITSVTLKENIDEYKDFRKLCIHLNGNIQTLTIGNINNDFKLTNTSYLTTDFINSQWVDLFRSDLHTCDAIIFIGFSVSGDLDIGRIIAEKLNTVKEKCFFIVSPSEKELNVKKLTKFGNVFKIGLNGFASEVKNIQKSFHPPEQSAYAYKSFRKYELPQNLHSVKDADFHNLVLKGDINFSLIHQSLVDSNQTPYFIFRDGLNEVFNKIENGTLDFVVHSDLGNGKTCFTYGLIALGINKGFSAFVFDQYYDLTVSEIEKICSLEGKVIVIIESYSNHFYIIDKFIRFRKKNVVIVYTERTSINDTVYDKLEDLIGINYSTINLNQLSSTEIEIFSDLLTSYGLWGAHASRSRDSKKRTIRDDFKLSVRLTLLDVLKSPDIQTRFTSLVDSLRDNKPFYNASLLIIASNILDFTLTLEDLVYILDDDLLNNPSFYNNTKLKEFIDFKQNRIRTTSSILSEGILHTNKYHADLIPLLVKVVKNLDKSRFNKNNYNKLRSIISHSRLQKLFNTVEHNQFRRLVIQFFEEVKNLNYSAKNPFFWLQYAIARLEIRDYPVADQFFNTAYSFADKLENFDKFQLDNHYARQLLENEIYNGSIETCMEQFLKAHKILNNRTDKNKNRHYPIKVAKNYSIFYDHYFKKLNEQDKRIFLVSCQEILRRIDDYNSVTDERSRHRIVKSCFDELSSILLKEGLIQNGR